MKSPDQPEYEFSPRANGEYLTTLVVEGLWASGRTDRVPLHMGYGTRLS